jgi:uncharacterized protein (DUF2141 family)
MKKIGLVFCLGVVVALAVSAFGQDKFTVSGTVEYVGKENIFICLLDQEAFKVFRKELPKAPFVQTKQCNQNGRASFTFDQVPRGDYIIIGFVDQNGNGKLDFDTWGFTTESTRSYKAPPTMAWNWNDQKFTVDKEVSGITLKF